MNVTVALMAVAATMVPAYAAMPAPPPPQGMINLVQGRSYTITPLVSIEYSFASGEANYYTPGALTDGQIASSVAYSDPAWQGYIRGGARSVVIDMGQVNTVHQMQERFLHYPSAGIYFPRTVTYSLSMNDTDWSVVGIVNSSIPLTTTANETQTYAVSGLSYQARYVKMTFTVDVNVFADEFQVFGDTGIVDSATVPKITPPATYPDAYCPPGSPEVGGTKNMVLIYNGYYSSNPAIGQNTVQELIPYVGYRTTAGTITDFMFDGFLFLPYGAAPSGGNYGANLAAPTVMSDWQYYLNNTFDPSYNLAALDSATGIVKKILNDASYKEKVEIAIPYPNPTATNFGNVDGVSENLSYLSAREQVLKWYVDQVISKWDSAGYANLDLVGFYWYSESAGFTVDDSESAMLNYIANYVTGLGKVLDWIPFKDASGFAEWSTLGFDGAWMQPNYAFHNYPEQELGETANAIKKLGMGIEIEINWELTDSTYRSKYYAYLNYGVTKGYMTGAAHTYYQGSGIFYESCISADPAVRDIYDQTYNFIKGTYNIPTAVNERPWPVATTFDLSNNYPNPFNPSTMINYQLAMNSQVSLKVYDVLGREVRTLVNEVEKPGSYEVGFDASGLPSGVYFYVLNAGSFTSTKKMLYLK